VGNAGLEQAANQNYNHLPVFYQNTIAGRHQSFVQVIFLWIIHVCYDVCFDYIISWVIKFSRFFDTLPVEYTAEEIVKNILYETEEAFVPHILGVFCLFIKQLDLIRYFIIIYL